MSEAAASPQTMTNCWAARHAEPEPQFPERAWRKGPTGYGLYPYEGYRIAPHVFDND